MTIDISNNDPRISYSVAQGVTQTSFAVPFEFFDDSDVNVYVDSTLKTITTDYTISGGGGSTGTVTISVTGATGGSVVVLTRDITIERTTDFTAGADINRAALNTQLDTLTAIAADVKDRAGLALSYNDRTVGVPTELPVVDTLKGKTLAFNASTGAPEAGPTISEVANAQTYANNAATSATASAGSATAAAGSASSASGSASAAASSASAASSSASAAASSASAAAASETAAETAEANTLAIYGSTQDVADAVAAAEAAQLAAETAETNAAASETAAASSESAAATSESNAATSATNASNSASAASTSATNASNSATAAASSAIAAAASETAAAASETAAASSETAAAASESAAAASESAAATSESNAASSASAASTSASNAATSETNAANSATASANSATASASSASAASASADAALAALDSFDDRYLGQKTSDPTLDNDGNPLVAGALYFNTTDDVMKVYEGSVWVAAYASLSGALLVSNNLSDVANAASSRTNLGLGASDSPSFAGLSVLGTLSASDAINYNGASNFYIRSRLNGGTVQIGTETPAGSLYYPITINGASDFTAFSTSTSEAMRITSTGSVGIGVSNPTRPLEVQAGVASVAIASTDTNANAELLLTPNGGGDAVIRMGDASSASDGLIYYENSANFMGFRTSGVDRLRITSTGNVGIGTSSPATQLEVNGTIRASGGSPRLSILDAGGATDEKEWSLSGVDGPLRLFAINEAGGGSGDYVEFTRVGNSGRTIRGSRAGGTSYELSNFDRSLFFSGGVSTIGTATAHALVVDTNNTERMRITPTGSVGIGTSSPSTPSGKCLTLYDAAIPRLNFKNSTTGDTSTDGSELYVSGNQFVIQNREASDLVFGTAATERARIDASGNLLVGMSASSSTSNGCRVLGVGTLTATRDGDAAAVFNRKTSDGTIVEFRKDSTTVATIGVESSDNVYFSATTGGGSGLQFWGAGGTDPLITPMTEGVASDAEVDLGRIANRFKDLYLSGGVYLGGTGSDNLLDDYEEGTWTVEAYDAASGGNASPTTATGYYTKVGRVVTASLNLGNVSTAGMTGANVAYFSLPFANANVPNIQGAVRLYANVDAATVSLSSQINANASRCFISESRDSATLGTVIVSDLISGVTDLSITITYFTDA